MECINIISVAVCFIKLVNKACGFHDLERLINSLSLLFVDIYHNCYIKNFSFFKSCIKAVHISENALTLIFPLTISTPLTLKYNLIKHKIRQPVDKISLKCPCLNSRNK